MHAMEPCDIDRIRGDGPAAQTPRPSRWQKISDLLRGLFRLSDAAAIFAPMTAEQVRIAGQATLAEWVA